MSDEEIIEKSTIEYDDYQKLYIATYGDIIAEGKTQVEATMALLEAVAWVESENDE